MFTRLVTILLALLFTSPLLATKGNLDPNWKAFDAGIKQAAKEKKYVLLDFYADWCSYCKMMEQITYKDSKVLQEMNKHFIAIQVDTESESLVTWEGKSYTKREFSAYMDVSGLPTILFLSPDAEVIGYYPSFADKDLMLQLLQYISSGARESGLSFGAFLESSK